MTDKQQIEEKIREMERIGSKRPCKADDCSTCLAMNRRCNDFLFAERLYNAGYRKVDENAVVLTRENINKYAKDCIVGHETGLDIINGLIAMGESKAERARKETATDFIFKVESYLGYNADNETFTKKELLLILAEVAKEQFGVEVE